MIMTNQNRASETLYQQEIVITLPTFEIKMDIVNAQQINIQVIDIASFGRK